MGFNSAFKGLMSSGKFGPELVKNYDYSLRNKPEECSSQVLQ